MAALGAGVWEVGDALVAERACTPAQIAPRPGESWARYWLGLPGSCCIGSGGGCSGGGAATARAAPPTVLPVPPLVWWPLVRGEAALGMLLPALGQALGTLLQPPPSVRVPPLVGPLPALLPRSACVLVPRTTSATLLLWSLQELTLCELSAALLPWPLTLHTPSGTLLLRLLRSRCVLMLREPSAAELLLRGSLRVKEPPGTPCASALLQSPCALVLLPLPVRALLWRSPSLLGAPSPLPGPHPQGSSCAGSEEMSSVCGVWCRGAATQAAVASGDRPAGAGAPVPEGGGLSRLDVNRGGGASGSAAAGTAAAGAAAVGEGTEGSGRPCWGCGSQWGAFGREAVEDAAEERAEVAMVAAADAGGCRNASRKDRGSEGSGPAAECGQLEPLLVPRCPDRMEGSGMGQRRMPDSVRGCGSGGSNSERAPLAPSPSSCPPSSFSPFSSFSCLR